MTEIFKPIKGYESKYMISNLGNVKNLRTGNIMKPEVLRNGYLRVELWKDHTRKHKLVHRLVAEAFIPNPLNLPQVNHKDEDKTNNSVDNVEWCDAKYNSNYGTRGQRIGNQQSKAIQQLDDTGKLIATYKSTKEAAEKTGFQQSNISAAALGKIKHHKGFVWAYV